MTEKRNDASREHHAHVFACYHEVVPGDKGQQQRYPLDEDTPDHRGKLRDRTHFRDAYFLSPSRYKVMVLNEDILDDFADRYGYSKLYNLQSAPIASYLRGLCRLNFLLSTGTVGSYIHHPRRGKTQLFRRDVDTSETEEIFRNPRIHTGRGYHSKDGS